MNDMSKRARAAQANELLRVIAANGRQFFKHGDCVSVFEVDYRGRVWWRNAYKNKRIYVYGHWYWRGFTEGGTLRQLVEYLRDFIRWGTPVPAAQFGPWPEWLCDGDLWGYGEDMEIVRSAARHLGVVRVEEAA